MLRGIIIFLVTALTVLCFSCETDAPMVSARHQCNTSETVYDTLVLLVMGQSNAANAGETIYASHCENTFNYFEEKLYPLNDPLKGANGTGGSVWSRLGDKITESNFAKTVIVAPCAIGGSSIEQWIPGGNYNFLIGQTVQHLHDSGLKVTHVLWHQGESNHVGWRGGLNAEQNAADYTGNFHLLVSYLRGLGVAAPVYAAIATRCVGEPDAALQDAQRKLQNDSLQIFNGPNTDLLDNSYRYDNCHFNEEGLKLHAAMWLEVLMK